MGDERLGESERRLGMMRIATKYPRIAERHFERTGRQVEVIEVKGSVELAPLIGLADGIVDLVATGRTLEENDLEVREEILVCTARFVANRVAHKLRAAEVDALTAKLRDGMLAMRARRFEWGGAAETAAAIRAWAAESAPAVDVATDRAGGRRRRRRGGAAPHRALRCDRAPAQRSLRVEAGQTAAALESIDPELRAAMERRGGERPRRRRGPDRP